MRTVSMRKIFLALLLAAGASAGFAANVPLDENLVALFADTHVTRDAKNPHQRAGVAQSVRDVLGLQPASGERARLR